MNGRGIVIINAVGSTGVESFSEHETTSLLKQELFLELQSFQQISIVAVEMEG